MPFDPRGFEPRPEPPRRPARAENALITLIAVLAFALLLLPVSADGVIDLVSYLSGR